MATQEQFKSWGKQALDNRLAMSDQTAQDIPGLVNVITMVVPGAEELKEYLGKLTEKFPVSKNNEMYSAAITDLQKTHGKDEKDKLLTQMAARILSEQLSTVDKFKNASIRLQNMKQKSGVVYTDPEKKAELAQTTQDARDEDAERRKKLQLAGMVAARIGVTNE